MEARVTFRDRSEAGRQLARALSGYRDKIPIVLAIPRGGVPVAVPIAIELAAPLDCLIVRKIGVPWHPELAMGAVVYGDPPVVVCNREVIERAGVSPAHFTSALERETMEAKRRFDRYVGDRPRPIFGDHTAIVVDDGIATGASMRAAVGALRNGRPRAIVVAVPVGATDTLNALSEEVDDVVCLEWHVDLGAIGCYYDDFAQVDDTEVIHALKATSAR
jgi:predicted phosphoribosyltransferase